MRWPHDSAITRRDAQLVRTRRLTLWVAGGATAASACLAAALGFALPGHTSTASAQPAGRAGTRSGSAGPSGQRTRSGAHTGTGGRGAPGHRKLAPPRRPPAKTSASPVVSSGGS
jgi:hypothetical protein